MTVTAKNLDRNRRGAALADGAGVSLSIRVVRPLLGYLTAKGHDSSAFLRAQGVDPLIFRDPEARLPHSTAVSLWPAAARLTNDLDLGLHVAEGIRPLTFGALGLALRTSENLGGAAKRLCRYHRLLHDAEEVRLAVSGDRVVLSHRAPISAGLPRAPAEYIVASWLVTSRQATGVNWNPLLVRFPHA